MTENIWSFELFVFNLLCKKRESTEIYKVKQKTCFKATNLFEKNMLTENSILRKDEKKFKTINRIT